MKKERLKNILILIILLAIGLFINIIFFQKEVGVVKENNNSSPNSFAPENNPAVNENTFRSFEKIIDNSKIFENNSISPEEGIKTDFIEYPQLTWKTKQIIEDTDGEKLNINYPYFLGNTKINNLNEYIENYIQNIIEEDKQIIENALNKQSDIYYYESAVFLSSTYQIVEVVNGIVSLELVITDFTGGGNGNHDKPVTINWDLKSNKLLTANQIFCSKEYSKLLLPIVQKGLFNKLYIENTPMGNWNTPEEYTWEHFLLKEDGIVVVFPPYKVSSGAVGIVRVLIPNSDIPNFLCLP